MKNIIYCAVLTFTFCLLFSCKKASLTQTGGNPVGIKIDSLTLKDSVAFNLNEQNAHIITNGSSGSSVFGNSQANRKIDSIIHQSYYYSGNKDSTLYYSKLNIFSEHINPIDSIYGLSVFFIKKFGNNQLIKGSGIQIPVNPSVLYPPGTFQYATDYQRENNQNGIAIEIATKAGTLYSYNPTLFGLKTTLTGDIQKNSSFQLINCKKLSNGSYLIEAKFSLNVFDKNEKSIKIENGYLRVIRFLY
jgi:hypothetical protein